MHPRRYGPALILCSALVACVKGTAASAPPDAVRRAADVSAPSQPAAPFARSPGGTSEVSPEAVARALADHATTTHIVDVREQAELYDELGHLPTIDWVPLGALAHASESWDPAVAHVLLCRSGRRSARGVELLETLGFRNVASMTGGMLRWNELGLPVSRAPVAQAGAERPGRAEPSAGSGPVQLDPAHVRWVRTAALLATGSESCVDGRDPHAVIGTPGGDAGELILAMAAVEKTSGHELTSQEVSRLLDNWVDAFGSLYFHTDLHALEALHVTLVHDPRFEAHARELATAERTELFVRHPARALEAALLEHLIAPGHVGCGHLRSMLSAPEAYQVRGALVADALVAIFQRLWRTPEAVDWVVLSGEHHERAVVVVQLDEVIRPYTKLPAISPASELGQAFVAHPQAAAYLREQSAYFLLEQLPWLQAHVNHAQLSAAIGELAHAQLEATLARLAQGLPRYEARFHGRLPAQLSLLTEKTR